MARRGIALLGSDQPTITQSDPEFSTLVASVLGNEITDGDGWDNDVAAVAATFGEDTDLIDSLSQHIADSDFTEGAADSSLLAPITSATAAFQTDGDALFSNMSDTIANDPSKPPPDSGGGGGQGGGGGDGGGGTDKGPPFGAGGVQPPIVSGGPRLSAPD